MREFTFPERNKRPGVWSEPGSNSPHSCHSSRRNVPAGVVECVDTRGSVDTHERVHSGPTSGAHQLVLHTSAAMRWSAAGSFRSSPRCHRLRLRTRVCAHPRLRIRIRLRDWRGDRLPGVMSRCRGCCAGGAPCRRPGAVIRMSVTTRGSGCRG